MGAAARPSHWNFIASDFRRLDTARCSMATEISWRPEPRAWESIRAGRRPKRAKHEGCKEACSELCIVAWQQKEAIDLSLSLSLILCVCFFLEGGRVQNLENERRLSRPVRNIRRKKNFKHPSKSSTVALLD